MKYNKRQDVSGAAFYFFFFARSIIILKASAPGIHIYTFVILLRALKTYSHKHTYSYTNQGLNLLSRIIIPPYGDSRIIRKRKKNILMTTAPMSLCPGLVNYYEI